MLFKQGATISAAEGGCMAEVGVACAMAAGGFAACLGASPEIIETAAEIGIEVSARTCSKSKRVLTEIRCHKHNLGLSKPLDFDYIHLSR